MGWENRVEKYNNWAEKLGPILLIIGSKNIIIGPKNYDILGPKIRTMKRNANYCWLQLIFSNYREFRLIGNFFWTFHIRPFFVNLSY